MASITLRSLKGAPLTITEMDSNFSNINTELGTKLTAADYTASDILTKLKTVDGATSGLDADLLDGNNSATAATPNTVALRDISGNLTATSFIGNLTGNVTGNVVGTATNITGLLAINNGGTGATSTTTALDNLLPAGEQSGYVLKTAGPGSYYWGAQTGNVTTAGTRIDTTRVIYSATSGQTLFTGTGTYTPGANQLRVYINGVRQFDSAYTESSSTSFTLGTGVSAGTEVMAEVDGYIEYDLAASEVTYSPISGITSTNVQDAISEVVTDVSPYTVPAGGIIMWSGSIANIPSGWLLCDGNNGTPNLTDKFVIGAGNTYAVGATGGSKDAIIPSHTHTFSGTSSDKYITQVQMSTSQPWSSPITLNYSDAWSAYIQTGRDDGGNRMIRFYGTTGTGTVSGTTGTTGSSVTNANLPPYYALCYIMKG